jgi:hypothetical protein
MGTVRVCSINYVGCPMVRSRISATVLGLLLCAASAAAQVNVTLQLPFAEMPARVSEWRENESLIRIVVRNTGREQYEGLMLSVELSKDGRRIARSRNGHPAQPRFSLRPGETRSLSWREVISEEAVEYDGSIRQQVAATGELPEGQYRLCVQVLNAQLRPISPQACGSCRVPLPDPPVLVSPIGGARVSPTPLLQWTPSYPEPRGGGLQYRVTVKVRYRGQTLAQAMASNPVRLQVTVSTTSYKVPVTEQLWVDADDPNYAGHVWQVQALLNRRPYGRNNGLSQIEWFVVPKVIVDPPPPPTDDRPTVLLPVLMWEVPYEEIRPGRPIKLQVPPIKEDKVLYVLRVRVPEKLSLQQLEQLRKNWAHEVRKEISAERTHQDTFVVQSYPPKYATIYRVGQDTFRVQLGEYTGEFAYHMGQDTAGAGVDRTRYTGGYFLYALPQDTTKPAELVDYYVPNGTPQGTTEPASAARINIKPLADRVVVEPVPAEDRRGPILVMGRFTPTHVGLRMPELGLDPGDGPVCDLPAREDTVRHSRVFVVNEAIASGAGPTGKTLGAVARQAPPQGPVPKDTFAVDPLPPRDSIRLHTYAAPIPPLGAVARQAPPQGPVPKDTFAVDPLPPHDSIRLHTYAAPIPPLGPSTIPPRPPIPPLLGVGVVERGSPVLWPNGNPPRDPRWPLVGVFGRIVINAGEVGVINAGEVGPATGGSEDLDFKPPKALVATLPETLPGLEPPKPWCGTDYIWPGPKPPKFWLTLRPR